MLCTSLRSRLCVSLLDILRQTSTMHCYIFHTLAKACWLNDKISPRLFPGQDKQRWQELRGGCGVKTWKVMTLTAYLWFTRVTDRTHTRAVSSLLSPVSSDASSRWCRTCSLGTSVTTWSSSHFKDFVFLFRGFRTAWPCKRPDLLSAPGGDLRGRVRLVGRTTLAGTVARKNTHFMRESVLGQGRLCQCESLSQLWIYIKVAGENCMYFLNCTFSCNLSTILF